MIEYIDRETGKKHSETIMGRSFLSFLYYAYPGRLLLAVLIKRRFFSRFYGFLMRRAFSRRLIPGFVRKYGINISECRKTLSEYRSFNDFFTRSLKENVRPVDNQTNRIVCCADSRLSVFSSLDVDRVHQIKGIYYSFAALTGDKKLCQKYHGGMYAIFRISPLDYHRFHFPIGGRVLWSRSIPGNYYSVNPLALRQIKKLFAVNHRCLCEMETDDAGDILFVDVAATNVGAISYTVVPGDKVKKGDERGVFSFGGSTVLMFCQSGRIKADADILVNTKQGYETYVEMGSSFAEKKSDGIDLFPKAVLQ